MFRWALPLRISRKTCNEYLEIINMGITKMMMAVYVNTVNMAISILVKLVADRWYSCQSIECILPYHLDERFILPWGKTGVKYYLYKLFLYHWWRNCTPISYMLYCVCCISNTDIYCDIYHQLYHHISNITEHYFYHHIYRHIYHCYSTLPFISF